MKKTIQQAPDYTMDEKGTVRNAKGAIIPKKDGSVVLILNGKTPTPFKVADLTTVEPAEGDPEPGEVKKEKKEKVKKDKVEKGPGVIATILTLITEKGPISKAEIMKGLVKKFPDREEIAMGKTVTVQITGKTHPVRMEKEKGVTFLITTKDEVNFYEIGKKAKK